MNNKIIVSSLVLALGIAASAWIIGHTLLNIKSLDDTISVSGSAKVAVTSDSAKWHGSFSRNAVEEQLRDGYAKMATDEKAVKEFLAAQGVKEEEVEISPIFVNEVYKYNDYSNGPTEYSLVQTIEVKSNEPEKLKEIAKNAQQLAEKGVIFSPSAVQYYYSALADARVSLLPDAIKDAKARAEAIASSSGQAIGSVQGVTMGVVQVMQAGSIDIDDYGIYDTSSIDKEIMVTVKATFSLE
jgi:hypothetical protein